jgi:DNA processing protein
VKAVGLKALATLAFAPRSIAMPLLPLAAEGAGAEFLLERAGDLGGFEGWRPDDRRLDAEMEALEKTNTRIVLFGGPSYPPPLLNVRDAPLCLHVRGDMPDPGKSCVAIVGSRASGRNCLSFTRDIARQLGTAGVPVVSGMARGVDSAAHWGCLDGGERTVAVLGCGADVCYPPDNRDLMERILRDGAVVSEFPMRTPPIPGHFPARNRIVSGLCAGTVVVEAARKGGGLITAKCATDQNRTVLAVPGAVWNPLSAGPNGLIKDGAAPVMCADDILEEIFGIMPRSHSARAALQPPLSGGEEVLLALLDYDSARHIDEIARLGRMPASKALPVLLDLEMKGLAVQLRGLRFQRAGGGA